MEEELAAASSENIVLDIGSQASALANAVVSTDEIAMIAIETCRGSELEEVSRRVASLWESIEDLLNHNEMV